MSVGIYEPRNLFSARLKRLIDADDEALDLLASCLVETLDAEPGHEIVTNGRPYRGTFVVLSGWAVRSRDTAAGDRQIINFLLPGDTIGYAANFFEQADHDVRAITRLRVARLDPTGLWSVAEKFPKLFNAFVWGIAQEEAMLRDQVYGLGRLRATERIKLMLSDLVERQTSSGIGSPHSHTLPITQRHVADFAGITLTHANRCFRELTKSGFARIAHRQILVTPSQSNAA